MYTKLLSLARDTKDGHARVAWIKYYQSKIALHYDELGTMLNEVQLKHIVHQLTTKAA